ncbi:MAG: PilT/PilU family type 4a pilus ATPase [Candidatus Vogelbacteria bacterium]|nr:PilT/PilU family type 4a pilus ATPase [Candidatus Vogelbacteria bacterium]
MTDYKKELNELIDVVLKEGASDLHISAFRKPSIRVSGELIPLVSREVLSPEDSAGLVFEMMGESNKKIFLENKDIDFAYSGPDSIRFRANAFFQRGFVGCALRAIQTKIKTIEELVLPSILKDFVRKKQGFFLVVGPVGQGKSTTLASMIDLINKERAEHILTIEDPIEYIFTGDRSIIDQREVRFDTASFQTALRSMFREDINVAMIGEMRTSETISAAVTAAETGHLIFSTLHTNNAAQTIDRIIDSFPAEQQNQIRAQLAGSLLGVFSQRLIPRISGGLVPAYELLINNSAVSNLIREGRVSEINVVIETGSESGMIDMNHSLAELVRSGEISQEIARTYSLNPRALERFLQ